MVERFRASRAELRRPTERGTLGPRCSRAALKREGNVILWMRETVPLHGGPRSCTPGPCAPCAARLPSLTAQTGTGSRVMRDNHNKHVETPGAAERSVSCYTESSRAKGSRTAVRAYHARRHDAGGRIR